MTNPIERTPADAVTDPSITPMDPAAGGLTDDKEQIDELNEEEVAAQLGDFA